MTNQATIYTAITFVVKAFDKNGKLIDSRDYFTPKLNQFNGHWNIVQRMATTLQKNKKVKTIRYYMDDVEYTFNSNTISFDKV